MDPKETIRLFIAACLEDDILDIAEHAANYNRWVLTGGFSWESPDGKVTILDPGARSVVVVNLDAEEPARWIRAGVAAEWYPLGGV